MDEQDLITQPTPEQVGPSAGDAWRDVVAQLDELGKAIGAWAKAAADDPENRRRVAELKERLDGLGRELGEAADRAAGSEVGQSFKEAAEKTGEAFKTAGEQFSEHVAPKIADALKRAAASMGEAADKMRERATDDSASEQPAPPGPPAEGEEKPPY